MNDSPRVAVGNGTSHLLEDMPSLRLWEVPPGIDVVQEISILSQLQHEESILLSLNQLIQPNDIGVFNALHNGSLSWKELGEVLLGGCFLIQDLDGNLQGKLKKSRW